MGGSNGSSFPSGPSSPSLLVIGSQSSACNKKYQNTGYWGSINGMVFANANSDGQKELIFGSNSLIQVNKISVLPPQMFNRVSTIRI